MADLRNTFRGMMAMLLVFGLMGALAYTVGLIQHWMQENMEPEAYGLSRLYTDEPDYTMPIAFWQGKGAEDPTLVTGRSHNGDVYGNITAFSLRRLNTFTTYDSVDWRGYNEDKYLYPHYATPTFTVQNKTGGEIFAVYEYAGYGNVVYSTDTTRRPIEYDGWLKDDWIQLVAGFEHPTFPTDDPVPYDSRYDVYTNYGGMVTDIAGEAVIHVVCDPWWTLYKGYGNWLLSDGPSGAAGMPNKPTEADEPGEFQYPVGIEHVSYMSRYPRCPAYMQSVYRYETTTYLNVYAMSPTDPDDVIVTARIQLHYYTPWTTSTPALMENRDSLTDEQKAELSYTGERMHWGCEVTLVGYEEELQMVE